jgi:hypothetical protein
MKDKDYHNLSLPKKIGEKIKEIEENVKTTLKKDQLSFSN